MSGRLCVEDKRLLQGVSCLTIDPDSRTVYAVNSSGQLVSIKTKGNPNEDQRSSVEVSNKSSVFERL